jgi:hypothetical protein
MVRGNLVIDHLLANLARLWQLTTNSYLEIIASN